MQHIMGIIGYGGMGGHHYHRIMEEIEGITIKGIFDVRDEAKEKAISEGLGIYESAEALLSDEEIELVLITTPNDIHKSYAIQCMKAGKHVISEKPVTLNSAELEEIIAVSKETGKLFTVHQNRRWDKDYLTIKKIVEENLLGAPLVIESRVQGSRKAMHGWRGHKQNGGGMLLDWGAHLIDQVLMMIDSKVVSVNAHLLNLYSDEVDDNIKIILRFENGLSTELEMSTNCLIDNPRWHMSCVEGTADVYNWAVDGKMVRMTVEEEIKDAEDIIYVDGAKVVKKMDRAKYKAEELPLPEVEGSWSEYYQNIMAVLEGKEEPLIKPEQVLRVMNIIDLAFKAEEEKQGFSCCI